MIFHLQAAGVPITWTIVALYRDSYGIALNSAKSWQEKESADRWSREDTPYSPPSPHALIEIENKQGVLSVKRTELLMDDIWRKHQQHDERNMLLQAHTSPLLLSDEIEALVTKTLTTMLKDFGYLIPKREWEVLYPAQKLISDHFRAFSDAHKAHRDAYGDDEMPFELRFAPYMPAPEGFKFPYGTRQFGDSWYVTKDGQDLTEINPADKNTASSAMRLLNSGYRLEDIPILLADNK